MCIRASSQSNDNGISDIMLQSIVLLCQACHIVHFTKKLQPLEASRVVQEIQVSSNPLAPALEAEAKPTLCETRKIGTNLEFLSRLRRGDHGGGGPAIGFTWSVARALRECENPLNC